MRTAGKVEYTFRLQTLYKNPDAINDAVGAIVNVNDANWLAVRKHRDYLWLLDSQDDEPRYLPEAEYLNVIGKHKCSYAIFLAEDMAEQEKARKRF